MSRIWVRGVTVLALCVTVSLGLVACGGDSEPSQKELVQAEKRGREYRAEKEKERQLENEIKQLQKERRQEKKQQQDERRAPIPAPAPAPESAPPSERTSCGGTLEVGPETTCSFAENVRLEYEYEIGSGPGTILAYSEANDELYEMSCTAAPHECTGAISARVYFP